MKGALRILLVVAVLAAFVWGDRRQGAREVRDAQGFVEEFYDWYASRANAVDASGPTWSEVVQARPQALDSKLLSLLFLDLANRAKSNPGEQDGVDWDPFLITQDPCPSYRTESVEVRDARFRVHVVGVCPEAHGSSEFDVVVDRQRRRWVIANVQDQNGYDAVRDIEKVYAGHR